MDPEPPTRQLPATPPPAAPVEDQRVVHAELDHRIRSLRNWLALATVLALAGLALATWALLSQEEEEDAQAGASKASVERLDSRIDDLEAQVDNRATKSSVSELRGEQEELSKQVQQVSEASGDGETEALQQSIEDLSADVQQLDQRVQAVEEQQAEQPAP